MRGDADALRIHFVAVGPRELSRVCGPLISLRADRAFLLRAGVDREAPYREKIREVLKTAKVEVLELDVEMSDPALLANSVVKIVESGPGMNYRFNLSTGPREAALGGYLVSMFWNVQPYWSLVAHDLPPEDSEFDDHPFSHTVNVPAFRQVPPRQELLDALEWLVDEAKPARQKVMIEALVDRGIIRPKVEGKATHLSAQAKQGQFRSIIEALQRFNFVRQESPSNPRVWSLTDQAKVALALFRGRRQT
jgi:hypothetical protein